MSSLLQQLWQGVVTRVRFAKAWVRDGKILWIWIAVGVAVIFLSYVGRWSGAVLTAEAQIRLAGMLFQFAGLLVVAIGLDASRRLFDKPSVLRAAWQWLLRLRYVLVPLKPITGSMHVTGPSGSMKATGQVPVVRASKNLEERVAQLEHELDRVDKAISEVKRSVSEVEQKMVGRIEREALDRRAADEKVGKQLEEAVVGGIHLEFGGLAYLFIGILLASLPEEVAGFLNP